MTLEISFQPTDHSEYGIVVDASLSRDQSLSTLVHILDDDDNCVQYGLKTARYYIHQIDKGNLFVFTRERINEAAKRYTSVKLYRDLLLDSCLALKDWAPLLTASISDDDTATFSRISRGVEKVSGLIRRLLDCKIEEINDISIPLRAEVAHINKEVGLGTYYYENGKVVSLSTHSPSAVYSIYAPRNIEVSRNDVIVVDLSFKFQGLVGAMCGRAERLDLAFSIYDPSVQIQVSESFLVTLEAGGID